MIVVSLLLILVAVLLLVVGLAGGSSILLICSIGASLLAAVALVIGARQTAAGRRAEAARAASEEVAARRTPVGEPAMAGARGGRRQGDSLAFGDDPPAQDDGLASPTEARMATVDDAEAALDADAAYRAGLADGPGPDLYGDGRRSSEPSRDARDGDPADEDRLGDSRPDDGRRDDGFDETPGAGSDDDRAGTVIGSARSVSPGENAWRRDHATDTTPQAGEPLRPDGPQRPADGSGFEDSGLDQSGLDQSGHDRAAAFDGAASASGGSSGETDEFADPDEDDPADEPPPQAVRPADAVRVARMTAEVLVVDGRPRYHLASCSHLAGRLTDPLPVNEAVELGFSPCGLCRPVDHLVAQAAHR
jgi:clumping factor A